MDIDDHAAHILPSLTKYINLFAGTFLKHHEMVFFFLSPHEYVQLLNLIQCVSSYNVLKKCNLSLSDVCNKFVLAFINAVRPLI